MFQMHSRLSDFILVPVPPSTGEGAILWRPAEVSPSVPAVTKHGVHLTYASVHSRHSHTQPSWQIDAEHQTFVMDS